MADNDWSYYVDRAKEVLGQIHQSPQDIRRKTYDYLANKGTPIDEAYRMSKQAAENYDTKSSRSELIYGLDPKIGAAQIASMAPAMTEAMRPAVERFQKETEGQEQPAPTYHAYASGGSVDDYPLESAWKAYRQGFSGGGTSSSVKNLDQESPLKETFGEENVPAAVVSPKPGTEYGQLAMQETKKSTKAQRIEAISRSAIQLLESPKVKSYLKTHFGVSDYKVQPTTGTWMGEPEPSFIITAPKMNALKAKKLANALGMGFWQDAAVHRTHNPGTDINIGTPTLLVGSGETLTPDQRTAILGAARSRGLDLTFSQNGKAAIFSHYGAPDEHEKFAGDVQDIAKETGMPELLAVKTTGDLDGAEKYAPQILGSNSKRARDQGGTGRPSDLFAGLVDNILAPFTKIASENGYRFSAERFADHHKLTDSERDYVYGKLIPPERRSVAGFGRTTIDKPVGYEYPGVYGDPRKLVEEAVSRVAEESPAMKRLFGVTRGDLYHIGANRVGNMEPALAMSANPTGSEAAQAVMTGKNEQRLQDILAEAGRHEKLFHGMDAWYVLDPLYQQMVRLMGKDRAKEQFIKLNTLQGMSSPGSEVPTELNRGFAAYYLQNQGRFDDFVNYAGLAEHRRGKDFPQDIADVMGHPYHSTSQAGPMSRYLKKGEVEMGTPKVPTYIPASGVPETGFQTRWAVPDAHYTRIIGMGESRKSSEPGVSMKMPEYQQIAPWHREKIAAQAGLEAVPAQARLWGAGSGATGVTSPIGAPKLEMMSDYIMQRAAKHGISPEEARDRILRGEMYAEGGEVEGGGTREPEAHGGRAFGLHPVHKIPGVHVVTADAGEPVFTGER
jgi:hypothetical protein